MTAAGSETKPTAEEASRPASAKAPSSRESLRHGTADAVVGGGGGGDDGDEAAHAFYARSVSDSYRLKSELVSRHLAEIGMGKFQWILFVVNGFGWCVDNFWSQGLTAARPPAGHEFFADGPAGGRLSFSSVAYYVGLMVGASFWSVSADLFGRKPAFNATLLLGGVFACAVAGAPSFAAFCALWALLGTAAGGNVPVDSIVFLEFVPRTHQWLLVTLSAWWNLGQIAVSLLAWVFLAHFACADGAATCARRDNMGWRYMMITLGAVALAFGLVRALLFRIPESPRYLLSKGRDADAVAAVNYIARYNGRPETLTLAMVQAIDGGPGGGGGAEPPLPGEEEKATTTAAAAARLSYADMVRASFQDYKASHVRSLFAGRRMAQHTAVSFLVWLMIGVAYPLYFAFIPSYLEAHRADDGAGADASSLDYTYKVYCIVSACGIVGPLAAGFAVETRFGRRWMMAGSAVLTGVFLFAYTSVRTRASDIGFQVATAILGNFEYAIMFAFTPESFPGPVRGTGTGIAATLLRFGGLIASIASIYGGYTATPVYASAAIWILAGLACFGLPYETHGRASI